MTILALLTLYTMQAQDDVPLQRLIERLKSDEPAVREQAGKTLLGRWKVFSEEEIATLRRVQAAEDAELSARIKEVLPRIELRRKLGSRLATKAEALDSLAAVLREPEGQLELFGFSNPGGPMFFPPPAFKEVVALGREVEPLVRARLKDPTIRSEMAAALAELGDAGSLPALIEGLPDQAPDAKEDRYAFWAIFALWRLTGVELGWDPTEQVDYDPQFKRDWSAWHDAHKDFLYFVEAPRKRSHGPIHDRVRVDLEAKVAGVPTVAFRKTRPWPTYAAIREWKEDKSYPGLLKDFCFSLIVQEIYSRGWLERDAVRALLHVRDPRALETLHHLVRSAKTDYDSNRLGDVIWTLSDLAQPSSLPLLKALPPPSDLEQRPAWESAIGRLQLRVKFGPAPPEAKLDPDGEEAYHRALGDLDCFLDSLRKEYPAYIAGFVRHERVTAALKALVDDDKAPLAVRLRAATSLARHGEKERLDFVRKHLTHEVHAVRLTAADTLWDLGSRDGLDALIGILRLRPLEKGTEGNQGNRTVRVEGTNVELIRKACSILGEMKDVAAIPALKVLLSENLNGIDGLPERPSGFSYGGRPDVVALARMGDFSGIQLLRKSLRDGDRLHVIGDYAAIGQKRFIPDLLPLLDHPDEEKRIAAASCILRLLESGE